MAAVLGAFGVYLSESVRSMFWNTPEGLLQSLESLSSDVHMNGGKRTGEPSSFSNVYKQEVKEILVRASQDDLDKIYEQIRKIENYSFGSDSNLLIRAIDHRCLKLIELLIRPNCPYLEPESLRFLPADMTVGKVLAANLLNDRPVKTESLVWRNCIAKALAGSVNNSSMKHLQPSEWSAILKRAKVLRGGAKGPVCCNEALAQFLVYPSCMEKVFEAVKNILPNGKCVIRELPLEEDGAGSSDGK